MHYFVIRTKIHQPQHTIQSSNKTKYFGKIISKYLIKITLSKLRACFTRIVSRLLIGTNSCKLTQNNTHKHTQIPRSIRTNTRQVQAIGKQRYFKYEHRNSPTKSLIAYILISSGIFYIQHNIFTN